MGSVGILSAAATNNSKVNIELAGDMPCMCPSDYLVAVTNTNLQDELKGGFGVNTIDIAAPGRVYTTTNGNNYGTFDGTSASTPIVTGAIGMMYAYPCEGFLEGTLTQPDVMALQMKDILLESIDPIEELFTRTVSGGRLNLFTLMQNMENQFGSAKGKLSLINLYPNPASDLITIEYQRPESTDYDMKVYDGIGRLVHHQFIPKICAPRRIEIPVADYTPGVYFITIENNNNIESSHFIVH
jgi:subtilisin family serine protease